MQAVNRAICRIQQAEREASGQWSDATWLCTPLEGELDSRGAPSDGAHLSAGQSGERARQTHGLTVLGAPIGACKKQQPSVPSLRSCLVSAEPGSSATNADSADEHGVAADAIHTHMHVHGRTEVRI